MSGRMGRTTTALNLRQGPGTQYPVLATLATGTLLTILEVVGEWFHVQVQEREGYVHRDYVEMLRAGKTAINVGLLASPGDGRSLIMALYEDTQLLVVEEEGGWLKVVALGHLGYVPKEAVVFPQVARTTDYVNLRAGPGTEHMILETLPPNTQVHVWARKGDWLYVADTVRVGYLHKDFVAVGSPPAPSPPPAPPVDGETSTLAPPPDERLYPPPDAGRVERRTAEVWNRVGGLLAALADQLGIEVAAAVAVLVVESGGRAFGPDGRMIIRFENQIFYDHWGERHPDRYAQHFTFNPHRRWTEHKWRPSPSEAWRPVHGAQEREWAAFTFARTLDETAAKLSISMGGPQIMGFNYANLGYGSVHEMYAAFASSERAQIVGLFTFIRGRQSSSPRLQALRSGDFLTFARLYNGPGQAQHYSALIREVYDAFRRLRAGQRQPL